MITRNLRYLFDQWRCTRNHRMVFGDLLAASLLSWSPCEESLRRITLPDSWAWFPLNVLREGPAVTESELKCGIDSQHSYRYVLVILKITAYYFVLCCWDFIWTLTWPWERRLMVPMDGYWLDSWNPLNRPRRSSPNHQSMCTTSGRAWLATNSSFQTPRLLRCTRRLVACSTINASTQTSKAWMGWRIRISILMISLSGSRLTPWKSQTFDLRTPKSGYFPALWMVTISRPNWSTNWGRHWPIIGSW